MSKTQPRWGGNEAIKQPEVPEWNLDILKKISELLGIQEPSEYEAMRIYMREISADYLRWKYIEEISSTRAEQRAELESVLEKVQSLEHVLQELNMASENGIIDELMMNTHKTKIEEELRFMQLSELRIQLEHLSDATQTSINKLKSQRGPDIKTALRLTIQLLIEYYEKVTGKKPTHYPYDKTEYISGGLFSEADCFVKAFFEHVDTSLVGPSVKDLSKNDARISTIMAELIKN